MADEPRWQRIDRIVGDIELFTVLALDHVGSFAQTVRPDDPASMEVGEIHAAKGPLIDILGPICRAILIDPGYLVAIDRADLRRPYDLGLIIGIEDGDYADVRAAPRLLPGWSVARAARLGADAVKISAYFDPDGDSSPAERFVREVVEQCQEVGVPLICEPLALYQDPKDRKRAVLEGVRRFGPLGAEVLKLQFPVMPEVDGNRNAWAAACGEIDRLSPVPWVVLSEGSDFGLFLEQVGVAGARGASGFVGGRAIWRELATGERDERYAMERLIELCDVAYDTGTAWTAALARRVAAR